MVKAAFLLSVILLSGCVFDPKVKPDTLEGAQCKQHCSSNTQLCPGSPDTCDSSYGKCPDACIDLESVIQED